jgi:methionyl aminopeptidase
MSHSHEELTTEARKSYEQAGRVASGALHFGAKQIKVGADVRAILDSVEEYLAKHGCAPAFPAQISVDHVAAHFCPTDTDEIIIADGQVVKIDVGAHHDGYIGDNAMTIAVGGKHDELVRASRDALDAAHKMLRAGVSPHEVGAAIQAAIAARGFQPIRNLTGHGLARFNIHDSPSMPNYPTGERVPLRAGQVIAIEPFATSGSAGLVYNGSNPTVFTLNVKRPVRSPYARETLALIEGYGGLPFTTRWLTRELGSKALLGLGELRRAGMLHEYPPLIERSQGLVAQSENTFLVTEDGCKVLTKDDD